MAYQSAYSARFRSGNSNYASIAAPGAGTQDKWKLRWDAKLGVVLSGTQTFISAGSSAADAIYLNSTGKLCWDFAGTQRLVSTAIFNDPGCKVTFEAIYDAGNATASLRARIFVSEGGRPLQEITAWDTDTRSSITTGTSKINTAVVHNIGRNSAGSNNYFDGLLDDFALINNSNTSGFSGQTNATTGTWDNIAPASPKWWLTFDTVTNLTTFGADSGSDNAAWTMNNFSLTAGVTYDALTDTGTNYGTDTGAGGEVRGNYCTMNPIWFYNTVVFANGNLNTKYNGSLNNRAVGTFPMYSGKWYFEVHQNAGRSAGDTAWGVMTVNKPFGTTRIGSSPTATADEWFLLDSGGVYNNGTTAIVTGLGNTTTGDIIQCCIDMDNKKIWWGRNGTFDGSPSVGTGARFTNLPADGVVPWAYLDGTFCDSTFNFGQRPFIYAAPTGFKALCTQNLSDPAIKNPSSNFSTGLRAGTGSAGSITGRNTGNLLWSKSRSSRSSCWADTARGAGLYTSSDNGGVNTSDAQSVTAFNSDGFSFGTSAILNTNGENFSDWLWTKGALPGVDIVTATAPGSAGTITLNHSLGVAPDLVIIKATSGGATDWYLGMRQIGSDHFLLDNFNGRIASGYFTAYNSTNIQFSTSMVNLGATYVAYLFVSVPGFSKIGAYTANGAADGPLVTCGFRPAWVLAVQQNNWWIQDNKNPIYNYRDAALRANSTAAELAGYATMDLVSSGFKNRTSGQLNASGAGYFMSFAEIPQKYSAAYTPAPPSGFDMSAACLGAMP